MAPFYMNMNFALTLWMSEFRFRFVSHNLFYVPRRESFGPVSMKHFRSSHSSGESIRPITLYIFLKKATSLWCKKTIKLTAWLYVCGLSTLQAQRFSDYFRMMTGVYTTELVANRWSEQIKGHTVSSQGGDHQTPKITIHHPSLE